MLAVLVLAGCASSPGPDGLAGFPTAVVEVGGSEWLVAVADTAEARRQGLRGVDDLGTLDGMIFVFPADTEAAFTMRDTLMRIDIAFFAADGVLVDRLAMVPCPAAPCPSYRASGPFRYAVETADGGFDDIGELTLVVPWAMGAGSG